VDLAPHGGHENGRSNALGGHPCASVLEMCASCCWRGGTIGAPTLGRWAMNFTRCTRQWLVHLKL
jgi:hypothetical protein